MTSVLLAYYFVSRERKTLRPVLAPKPVKRGVEKLAHSLTFPEPGLYTARRSEARFTGRLEEPAPMSLQDRFEELHRRNEAAELSGGVQRIERQHKTGKKTARERL